MPPDTTRPSTCPFCERVANSTPPSPANALAVAFADAYPLNPGHTLIVPRRHVARFCDLTAAEREALWDLVPCVREAIEREHTPDGYNLGLNDGVAAGQTIPHAHLHVIPRYSSDVPDPRGGVRWVLPARAAYWPEGRDG
jgi:diadenosine tetraphosphate (Ap4A) HIT family hydrolase